MGEVFYSDPLVRMTLKDNVLCMRAGGELTAAHVAALQRGYTQMRQRATRFASITVVVPGGRPGITPEARSAIQGLAREFEGLDVGAALVMTETGMKAALIRSILAGISLMARTPTRVFSDVDEAAGWISGALTKANVEAPSAAAIRDALAAL